MEDRYLVAIVGLVCLTVIVCTAISHGINGVLISSTAGIIGTIVGYCFGVVKKEVREEKKEEKK